MHFGNKIGVLLEIACEKAETTESQSFKDLTNEITLHIAAAAPLFLDRSDIPADVLATEREIYANQVKDKPAQIVDKIVDGKIAKFYSQSCLVEQASILRESGESITEMMEATGKELGDTISIRRFVRFQLGEVKSAE